MLQIYLYRIHGISVLGFLNRDVPIPIGWDHSTNQFSEKNRPERQQTDTDKNTLFRRQVLYFAGEKRREERRKEKRKEKEFKRISR